MLAALAADRMGSKTWQAWPGAGEEMRASVFRRLGSEESEETEETEETEAEGVQVIACAEVCYCRDAGTMPGSRSRQGEAARIIRIVSICMGRKKQVVEKTEYQTRKLLLGNGTWFGVVMVLVVR